MSDLTNFGNMVNIPQFNLNPQIDMCQAINRQFEERQRETFRAVETAREERERNEREKRESLKRIADNSEDTVNSLKETNELLRQNNELLKLENENLSQRLDDISRILSKLFELEEENGDAQKDLLQQAVALAVQIDMSITENGKFDWKSALANTTTTGLFMGLQVYLHSKGLL